MLFCGKTNVGKVRDNNQDSFFADYIFGGAFLAVVCDGMGGANGGNIASELAVSTFVEAVTAGIENLEREKLSPDGAEGVISHAVSLANERIYEKAQAEKELEGMGTTLVCLLLYKGMAYIANIGDSRLYVVTKDTIAQITHDHSYVQTLVDKGKLLPDEAKNHPNKNVIMRAVGTDTEVRADFFKLLYEGKGFLLCSDGLSNFVIDEEMQRIIREAATPEIAVDALIKKANKNGGSDNITAVLVKN